MAIINKYWRILETLHFPMVGAPKEICLTEEQRVKANLRILKDCINLSSEDIVQHLTKNNFLKHPEYKHDKIFDNADDYFLYCLYSCEMLMVVLKNSNLSSDSMDDLVSEKHKSLIISSVLDVASFALQENLHNSFYTGKGTIFKRRSECETNFNRLEFIVEIFSSIIYFGGLRIGKSLDDVQLWYMASIFSLLIAFDSKDCHLEQSDIGNLKAKLLKLWLEFSKKLYYRNLMLLYSSLPNTQKKVIHREMLMRLWSPGGFVALLSAMAESQPCEQQLDEIVANLVAQPNFSIKAQHSLIKQVLQFLKASLKNTELSALMGPGLLSLRKLYNNKSENKKYIKKWLEMEMEPLIKVETSQIIAMEWLNFIDLITLLFQIFCTSSIATLPSDLLIPYLPVVLELYSQLECHTGLNTLKNHLHSLTLKILNDLSKSELNEITEYVTFKSYPKEWYHLSSNILIKENPLNMQGLRLSLVDNNALTSNKHSLAILVAILKRSSYNLLVFQHFIMLLQLVPSLITDKNSSRLSNSNIDLLETKEDICNKMLMDFSQAYEYKIQIIKALESLVQHQPLKALINENIKELLKVLQNIIMVYTETLSGDSSETEINSTVIVILLILIREIIENSSIEVEDLQKNLLRPLKHLQSQTQNENVKYQTNCVLKLIEATQVFGSSYCDLSENEFEEARSLTESHKSYLQVEGIEKMIKLINKRDAFTVANSHILIALALNTLKSPESYTFLNCVRLFVALVNVNETEVLDILSDEYTNEAADMDYRLLIGEALLKTSSELGHLCYKYKDVLLNTYMTGCRSPLNEFRFSAFSNLSHMCRQLTYQVHNYFQELLNLIDCELTTGKYLPAKRAAVLVLSDLLSGMDNLFDYQEMLLPIYRLLKHLVALENNDEKIRIHASNGLQSLSEKCKELFRVGLEQQQISNSLEKEIKIMGIRDNPRGSLKSNILEIN